MSPTTLVSVLEQPVLNGVPVASPSAEVKSPLVTIQNLTVKLGDREILRRLNASIPRGKISALIGLNGSGKTTLLRTLLKEHPFTGQIVFHCGHDHTKPWPEHIGYVPQRLQIDARLPLTVRDLFGLALQSRSIFMGFLPGVRTRTRELLTRIGASRLIDSPVEKLSGGELQRVLLALALEPIPELLLLDEPSAGIDFRDQLPFYETLARVQRESKMTVVLVSHELNVVTQYADYVFCLNDGRVDCEGVPQDVLTQEMLAKTFGSGKRVYIHEHGVDCGHEAGFGFGCIGH
jgi:zinc transport system ATP-binding protein